MLNGKIALITGAGRGIGLGIAEAMAAEGAFVILNYNGSEARALAAAARINGRTEGVVRGKDDETTGLSEAFDTGKAAGRDLPGHGGAETFPAEAQPGHAAVYGCNVSDYDACQKMIETIVKKYGRLDILVNNAGITRDGLVMKMSEADFDDVIATNLKGTFHTIRHASRYFLKQRAGRIINLSSVSGVMGNAGQANYSASKAGVIGLTKSVARELASRGITCNAIAPGYIETEMTEAMPEAAKEALQSQIPLQRTGKVEDIAQMAVFLASDRASYITGQVIAVDGGMSI